jgi:transposase-like protein
VDRVKSDIQRQRAHNRKDVRERVFFGLHQPQQSAAHPNRENDVKEQIKTRLLSGFRVTRWEGLEKGPGGAKAEGMLTVMDLGNEEKCYEELRRVLWPGGKAICPKCGSDHTVKNGHKKKESARQRYKCKECESRFDDLTGTVFAKRHKPLTVWLTCLYLMSLNQSTEQIKNDLGLCRSDAQDMAQALRQAIVDKRPEIIVRGEVECDEVYIVAGHKGKPEEVKKKTDAGAGAGSKGGEGGEEWKRKSLQFLALFSEAAPSRYMFCQTFKSGEYCQ